MTLDEYVRMAAAVIGVPEAEHPRALAAVGATPEKWSQAMLHFGARHAEPAFNAEYATRFRQALEARCGAVTIDFDRYVQSAVLQEAGMSFDEAARAIGLGMAELFVAGYAWSDQLGADARLMAVYTARVKMGRARHARGARPVPPPQPATHVSALRCPRCGAPKVTRSRTAYVHCDYCALLFDYDFVRAEEAMGGLPLGEVTETLRQAVLPEIRAAREGGDEREWLALWTWVYRTEMEVCPETWSPRAGDDGYRAAMAEWCARTSIVRAQEPSLGEAAERTQAAWERAIGRPSAAALVKYAEACVAEAEVYREVWGRRGLFASHPDELDPDSYRRIEVKRMLRECLPNAEPSARERILGIAGMDLKLEPVPPVDLEKTVCSGCGGQLLAAANARRLLCEACGDVLDAGAPRFPCPSCGAKVVAAKTGELACGWCSAHFECV